MTAPMALAKTSKASLLVGLLVLNRTAVPRTLTPHRPGRLTDPARETSPEQ